MTEQLRKDIDSIKVVQWPPKVEELEQEEELPPLVIKLLSALQGKKELQLPGMLCIKRKQETILCCSLVSEDITRCIVQFHIYYRL